MRQRSLSSLRRAAEEALLALSVAKGIRMAADAAGDAEEIRLARAAHRRAFEVAAEALHEYRVAIAQRETQVAA